MTEEKEIDRKLKLWVEETELKYKLWLLEIKKKYPNDIFKP